MQLYLMVQSYVLFVFVILNCPHIHSELVYIPNNDNIYKGITCTVAHTTSHSYEQWVFCICVCVCL